jgi:DNA-binding Lrp family transcriptional regulator
MMTRYGQKMPDLLPLDDLDRRLIAGLRELTRPRVLELSRELGVARNTVQARLDRLEAAGVLGGYGPLVDLKAAGFGVLAFTTLEIAQGQERAVIDALQDVPEVLEAHKITGPGDVLCRLVARSNDHLHDVLERVLATPGIVRTTTSLALDTPVQHLHTVVADNDLLSSGAAVAESRPGGRSPR